MSVTEIILLIVREGDRPGMGPQRSFGDEMFCLYRWMFQGHAHMDWSNHPSVHCTVWNAIVHTADPLDHTFWPSWVQFCVELLTDTNYRPCGSSGREPACNGRDLVWIPGLGRSTGEGKGYPLQYSGLESFMDCLGWQKVRQGWVSFTFTFHSTIQLWLVEFVDGTS